MQGGRCNYTSEEVKAAADQGHERVVCLSGHVRLDKSGRIALYDKFRVLYHCEYSTDETLDMIEAVKDQIFVAPSIGANYRLAHHAQEWGITREEIGRAPCRERVCQNV